MMEETQLINRVKEQTCFVSRDFRRELELLSGRVSKANGGAAAAKKLECTYILPDYNTDFTGHVMGNDEERAKPTPSEHILVMKNERIVVPELLFNPSDIGVDQAGVAEACLQAAKRCARDAHRHLYANILAVGGSTLFPGFVERLQSDIQKSVPDECTVQVHVPKNATTCTWEGAALFVANGLYDKHAVTRAQYQECGDSYLLDRWFM
eukprot:TRINITY_DN3431_c0_g1_i3.p1 TRINITY_DN3431_c0_g1~~TRINITY_DN3431_c0_g1_i3.p1  ORF type:complete len:209 (-),score=43.35 TRINITY_DN3431_c0_g1_i3:1316-1942(-)